MYAENYFNVDQAINEIKEGKKNSKLLTLYKDYVYRSLLYTANYVYEGIFDVIRTKFKEKIVNLKQEENNLELAIKYTRDQRQMPLSKYKECFPDISKIINIEDKDNIINKQLNLDDYVEDIIFEMKLNENYDEEQTRYLNLLIALALKNKSVKSVINNDNYLVRSVTKLAFTRYIINMIETNHKEELNNLLNYNNLTDKYQTLKKEIFNHNAITKDIDYFKEMAKLFLTSVNIDFDHTKLLDALNETKILIENCTTYSTHPEEYLRDQFAKYWNIEFGPIDQSFFSNLPKEYFIIRTSLKPSLVREFNIDEKFDQIINKDGLVEINLDSIYKKIYDQERQDPESKNNLLM